MMGREMNREIRDYFDTVPKSRRSLVAQLHAAVLDGFPGATIDMRYKMPTYSYGEGWVAIANQKNYVSLYTCSAAHLVKFKEKYPSYKTGKGRINFHETDEIPLEAVKAVIKHAMLYPKNI